MRAATAVAGLLATVAVTSVAALADCAAVGVLRLTIVPALDTGRRRAELAVKAAWQVTEVARQLLAAA